MRFVNRFRQRLAVVAVWVLCALGAFACAPQSKDAVPLTLPIPASLKPTTTLRLSVAASQALDSSDGQLVRGSTSRLAISKETFHDTLEDALFDSGLFKSIGDHGTAEYELSTLLFSDQASLSGDGSTTLGVRYTLVRTLPRQVIWTTSIVSECPSVAHRTMFIITDAFTISGSEPKCTMRKNFTELVNDLSKIKL